MKHILDTGPLVAYLVRNDRYHAWAVRTLDHLGPPLLTCEAVLAEAIYLSGARQPIMRMLAVGDLQIAFDLEDQAEEIGAIFERYADQKIDLADACLLRMSELFSPSEVITLDRTDFSVYRRHRRERIPLITPG